MAGLLGIVLFLGAMAFFIAYDETSRHFPNRAQARHHALGTALVAFAFFAILGALLVFFVFHNISR